MLMEIKILNNNNNELLLILQWCSIYFLFKYIGHELKITL